MISKAKVIFLKRSTFQKQTNPYLTSVWNNIRFPNTNSRNVDYHWYGDGDYYIRNGLAIILTLSKHDYQTDAKATAEIANILRNPPIIQEFITLAKHSGIAKNTLANVTFLHYY
jgi:hypothetical protein